MTLFGCCPDQRKWVTYHMTKAEGEPNRPTTTERLYQLVGWTTWGSGYITSIRSYYVINTNSCNPEILRSEHPNILHCDYWNKLVSSFTSTTFLKLQWYITHIYNLSQTAVIYHSHPQPFSNCSDISLIYTTFLKLQWYITHIHNLSQTAVLYHSYIQPFSNCSIISLIYTTSLKL